MAAASAKEYVIRGCKISLNILQDIAGDLPAPTASIVNLVQRAVATSEVSPLLTHLLQLAHDTSPIHQGNTK